ncbi:MAG: hypothetical protein Q7T19_05655 [Caulobacter sp.]|nr:hypothetical protein [Caulobacter sp.]
MRATRHHDGVNGRANAWIVAIGNGRDLRLDHCIGAGPAAHVARKEGLHERCLPIDLLVKVARPLGQLKPGLATIGLHVPPRRGAARSSNRPLIWRPLAMPEPAAAMTSAQP